MNSSNLRVWSIICVLCVSSFIMVTTEFTPIGLLSQISSDLKQAPSTVGLTVTLYAWLGAASGLMSNVLNRWVSRKTLLIGLMLVLAISNCLSAFSHAFVTLLFARAVGAVAHGVFWAIVAATAASIVPAQRVGLATSIVLAGITLATVLGVPLTNLLGQHYSWRIAFQCLAAVCAVSACTIALIVPSIPIQTPTKGMNLASVLKRKDLMITYAITGLTAAAHFSAYTFVEPYIRHLPGITTNLVTLLLFLFGAAGFLGNVLSALFLDRFLKKMLLIALLFLSSTFGVLGGYGPEISITSVTILLMIWGAAISTLFTGLQTWVLSISGRHTIPATAVHTAVLNSSIGIGVLIGGSILSMIGTKGMMLSASVMIIPGIMLLLATYRFKQR